MIQAGFVDTYGITFNQFLVNDEKSMLIHTGDISSFWTDMGHPYNSCLSLGRYIADTLPKTWACPNTKFRPSEYASKSQTANIIVLLSGLFLFRSQSSISSDFHCLLFLSNELSDSKVSFIGGNTLIVASKYFDSLCSNEVKRYTVNSNEIGWIIMLTCTKKA